MTKKCTIAPRHKWVWQKDKTVSSSTFSGRVTIARKGIYKCECGALKYGEPHSGLPG